MPTPASLGDLSYQVTYVMPLATSSGSFYIKTSGTDTGTKATTSRTIDLKKALHETGLTTGAKPLDATVHPRAGGPARFKSLSLSIPLKMNFHTSGLNCYLTVAHKTRAATSGAGSTWATLKTDIRRFKMGTDTDAVLHSGVFSSVNAQGLSRYYKANITVSFKLASSTSAKDTTTAQGGFVIHNPSVILSGTLEGQTVVPAKV